MAGADATYIVEVQQKFSQVGLDRIVATTRAAFEELAREAAAITAQFGPNEVRARAAAISGYAGERVKELDPKFTGGGSASYANEYDKTFTALRRMRNAITDIGDFDPASKKFSQSGAFDLRKLLAPYLQPGGNVTQTEQLGTIGALRRGFAGDRARELGVHPDAVLSAEDDIAARQRHAEIQKVLAADNAYAKATAEAAIDKARIHAQVQKVLGADDRYASATASAAQSMDAIRARTARLSNTPAAVQQYAQAEAEEARLRTEQRLAATKARSSEADIRREALADVQEQRRRTKLDFERSQLRRPDTPVGAATARQEAQTKINEDRRAAFIRESVARDQAADNEYIQSKARTAEAERLRAARIRAERYGVNTEGRDVASLEAENAIRARITAEEQATAVARQQAGQQGSLGAQLAAAQQERIQAERAAAISAARSQIASGQGTLFQRLQSRFSLAGPNPRGPQDFSTFGSFVGQKAVTTAGYAIPGALLYGAIGGIGQMVEQAEELERTMSQVKAVFESLGQGEQFEGARRSILEMAQNTGIAADEIANVFLQFKGAFQDTDTALEQTNAAMKIVQVTGLSAKEVIDSLTATSKTFADEAGNAKPIEELGNVALALQEQFGVTANETLTFVADLAAVGEEAGASAEELAGLGATANQLSGRSGAALAESFGRILPAIQEARDKVISLYNAPNLAASRGKVLDAFARGDTFDVLKILLADKAAGRLTDTQEKLAISLLGSRREAQALIPVFKNANQALETINGTADEVDNGKLDQYFERASDTVKVTIDRMREAFKQLGQSLFDAGLADVLRGAAGAAEVLAAGLGGVLAIVKGLSEVTAGWSNRLIGLGVLAVGLNAIFKRWIQARLEMAAATGVETAALTAETAAEGANTASAVANTAAEAAQTRAKRAGGLIPSGGWTIGGKNVPTAATGAIAAEQEAVAASRLSRIGSGISGGISGAAGAAAAFGPTALVALAVAGTAKSYYDQYKSAAREAGDKLREEYKKKNLEELKDLGEQHSSFWTRLKNNILNEDLPEDIARESASEKVAVGYTDPKTKQHVRGAGEYVSGSLSTQAGRNAFIAYRKKNQQRILDILNDPDFLKRPGVNDDDYRDFLKIASASQKPGTPDIFSTDPNETDPNALRKVEGVDLSIDNVIKQVAAAKKGNTYSAEFLKIVAADLRKIPALKPIIDDYFKTKEGKAAEAAAGGPVALISADIDTIKSQYSAGIITGPQYVEGLQQQIKQLESQRARGGGAWDDDAREKLANTRKDVNQYFADEAQSMYEAVSTYNDITTGGKSGAENYFALVQQVQAKNPYTGLRALSLKEQLAKAPDLWAAAQKAFQDELDSITEPAQRLARMQQGIDLDPELRRLLAISQLGLNADYQEIYAQLVAAVGQVKAEGIQDEVVQFMLKTNATVREALNAVLQDRINAMQRILDYAPFLSPDQRSSLQEGIAKLESQRVAATGAEGAGLDQGINVPKVGQVSPDEKKAEADKAKEDELAIRRAALERQKVRVRRDPVAVARIDLQIAQLELQYAKDAVSRANALTAIEQAKAGIEDATIEQRRENTEARFNFLKAQAGANSGEVARLEVLAARFELSQARTEAERLNAQARLAEANRAAQTALLDAFTSINDTIAATAEAAGDTIKVQQIAVKNAKARLEIATRQGAGVTERNQLRQELIRAQASLRDTRFQEQLGDIDFLQQMERISTQQAIQLLRAMLQIPTNTEKMNRELMLKIKALQDELSQDFQFNIPDININGLLYQSRRLNETGGRGQLYQDNRNQQTVNMNININSDADVAAAVDQIQQAVNPNTPSGDVFGTYVGLY